MALFLPQSISSNSLIKNRTVPFLIMNGGGTVENIRFCQKGS